MRGKIEATIKHKGGENFGNGSVARHILRLALPMTLAQFINVLYNKKHFPLFVKYVQNSALDLQGISQINKCNL